LPSFQLLRHLQVLGGTVQDDDVGGRDVDHHAVAELGGQFERAVAARQVGELHLHHGGGVGAVRQRRCLVDEPAQAGAAGDHGVLVEVEVDASHLDEQITWDAVAASVPA